MRVWLLCLAWLSACGPVESGMDASRDAIPGDSALGAWCQSAWCLTRYGTHTICIPTQAMCESYRASVTNQEDYSQCTPIGDRYPHCPN